MPSEVSAVASEFLEPDVISSEPAAVISSAEPSQIPSEVASTYCDCSNVTVVGGTAAPAYCGLTYGCTDGFFDTSDSVTNVIILGTYAEYGLSTSPTDTDIKNALKAIDWCCCCPQAYTQDPNCTGSPTEHPFVSNIQKNDSAGTFSAEVETCCQDTSCNQTTGCDAPKLCGDI